MFRRMRDAFVVAVLFTTVAFAVPVEPGQTVTLPPDADPDALPTEGIIDENTRTVDLFYQFPEGFFLQDGSATFTQPVSFHEYVLRDSANQTLGFVYEYIQLNDTDAPFGTEGGDLQVSSFTGFATDVDKPNISEETFSRSADGSTIEYDILGQGVGGPPGIVVFTDATDYDSNGTVALRAAREFLLYDAEGSFADTRVVGGTSNVTGTFQPIAAGEPPPPPVIPLPPAVWTGLITLMSAGGYAHLWRRKM